MSQRRRYLRDYPGPSYVPAFSNGELRATPSGSSDWSGWVISNRSGVIVDGWADLETVRQLLGPDAWETHSD